MSVTKVLTLASGGLQEVVPATTSAGSADAGRVVALSTSGLIDPSMLPGATTTSELALSPSAAGNFTVAHGLGVVPKLVVIQMTSSGQIWVQPSRYDATNIYLVASNPGVTGYAEIFQSVTTEIALAPVAAGNFTISHGQGRVPKMAAIQMTSSGQIWWQAVRYDATNIYLVASNPGLTGYAEIFP